MAFLFGLFVPALSHAMAHATAQPASAWITALGSASGTRHVMVIDDAAQTDTPAVPDMSHCELCCSHHHTPLAPPLQAAPVLALHAERDSHPPLFYQAPRTQHAWTPSQSRGPPSSHS